MAEELKNSTVEEIDAQIKTLQEQKKKLIPSSYDVRPVREKILYDLQPMKLFTTAIKTLIVLALIAGIIYLVGYRRGRKKTVNDIPIKVELKYGKEAMIQLNKEGTEYLHITKNGDVHIQDSKEDITAKNIYSVTTKDIPGLWEKLKPYGFDIKAFIAAGGSIGNTGPKSEVGVGMQWYKFYKTNINSFLTTTGIYPIGIGYRLTDNIDALLGGGFGYKGDQRVYLGIKAKFN
jgi:hypothetical protein